MDTDLSSYLNEMPHTKSGSQKARMLTEKWTSDNLECPNCGGKLSLLPANSRTSDLQCQACRETYQLKSQKMPFGKKILGAEYRTTIQAISSGGHPSLILLQYDLMNSTVQQLRIIHRSWITVKCIIPRCPLGPHARRAGWQGCLWVLESIPRTAFIEVVRNASAISPLTVRSQWLMTHSVSTPTKAQRGWVALVLQIVELLPQEFTLQQVYAQEKELAKSYPANQNIRAKIRQQLQIIRDLGLIQFIKPSVYRRVS